MKDFSGLTKQQVNDLKTAIVGGCLGSMIMLIASFFGFHIFMNEFIKELNWQKTFLIWISILVLANRLKG